MFKFLFLLFFLFVFLVFLFGFSILRMLFGGIFGSRPRFNQQQNQSSSSNGAKQSSGKTKKIIDSNEGEYIDYEEIKD